MGKERIRKGDPCLLNLLPGIQPVPNSACQQEEVRPRERWAPLAELEFQVYPHSSGSIEQNADNWLHRAGILLACQCM